MRKFIFLLLLILPYAAYAQNVPLISYDDFSKSHINLEFAASANTDFTDGEFQKGYFKMNRVRLEILGDLNSNLSYHFRQAFNRNSAPLSLDNIASSVEYAYVKWRQDKFELFAGKQFLALAGYENWVNGLKVREYSEFNNNYEFFQTGITGVLKFTPDQHLLLQVANHMNGSDNDVYKYGLPNGIERTKLPLLATASWNGWFADGALFLMYSASAGQLAKGKNVYYLMCGNIYEKGPVLAYLDVLYGRYGLDVQQRVTGLQGDGISPVTAQNTEYFTVIANFDYRFHPKWNGYIKGAYETAGVYEANGPFVAGKYMTSWNAQACLEWFPWAEASGFKVFLHAIYRGHDLTGNANALGAAKPHTQRISLGVQYIIPVL